MGSCPAIASGSRTGRPRSFGRSDGRPIRTVQPSRSVIRRSRSRPSSVRSPPGFGATSSGRMPPRVQAQNAAKKPTGSVQCTTAGSPARTPFARRPARIRAASSSSVGKSSLVSRPSAPISTTPAPPKSRAARSRALGRSRGYPAGIINAGPVEIAGRSAPLLTPMPPPAETRGAEGAQGAQGSRPRSRVRRGARPVGDPRTRASPTGRGGFWADPPHFTPTAAPFSTCRNDAVTGHTRCVITPTDSREPYQPRPALEESVLTSRWLRIARPPTWFQRVTAGSDTARTKAGQLRRVSAVTVRCQDSP